MAGNGVVISLPGVLTIMSKIVVQIVFKKLVVNRFHLIYMDFQITEEAKKKIKKSSDFCCHTKLANFTSWVYFPVSLQSFSLLLHVLIS